MTILEAGYRIYDHSLLPNDVEYYDFEASVGGRGIGDVVVTHNENRLELKTFGRTPYVYYAGHTDYATFDLSTVFYYDDEKNESARRQMDRFKTMIKQRKALMVENSQGSPLGAMFK